MKGVSASAQDVDAAHVAGVFRGPSRAGAGRSLEGQLGPYGRSAVQDRALDDRPLGSALARDRPAGRLPARPPDALAADTDEAFLCALVEATPEITLDEMRARLGGDRGVSVVCSTIWRFFAPHGWTVKTEPWHADEQGRPDVAAARQAWFEAQADLDLGRLISIDGEEDRETVQETVSPMSGLNTKMTRPRRRALRGERLHFSVPHGPCRTTTIVAGMRLSDVDAPINGEIFYAYADRVLVLTLRPGEVVIIDNPGSEMGASMYAAREAAGATIRFLPPYRPESRVTTIGQLDRLLRGANPSKTPLPSSRHRCERRPPTAGICHGMLSPRPSRDTTHTQAITTSPPPATSR
ncbi:MAG: hypothetical protein AAF899_01115 [Pseudomonadota bacterium]